MSTVSSRTLTFTQLTSMNDAFGLLPLRENLHTRTTQSFGIPVTNFILMIIHLYLPGSYWNGKPESPMQPLADPTVDCLLRSSDRGPNAFAAEATVILVGEVNTSVERAGELY